MPSLPLITIVDDDDAMRTSLQNLIRSAGFRAQGFSSGEALLDFGRLDETASLILDVQLPGMSGLELQARLRSAKVPVPIVFITAYENEIQRSRALASGAVAFLYKPVREQDLLDAINAALNGK